MVTLTIKYGDGSHYWGAVFNTRVECDKWIAEEMTRPYWKDDMTFQIDDQTAACEAAEVARKKEMDDTDKDTKAARKAIKDAAKKKGRSLQEANDLIDQIVQFIGMNE